MKLQLKILSILIPLVVLPLLGLGVVAYDRLNSSSKETILQQMNTLLEQVTLNFQFNLRTAEANVDLFSRSSLLKNYLLTENEEERYYLLQTPLLRLFQSYNQAYPNYYEIRVLLPDGYEDARFSVSAEENLTDEEEDSPFFKELQELPDEQTYTNFLRNPDNGEHALVVAKKLKFISKVADTTVTTPTLRGYLGLTARLDYLKQQVLNNRIGEKGFIVFTNEEGEFLFSPSHIDLPSGFPLPLFERIKQEVGTGTFSQQNFLGNSTLFRGTELHPKLFLFAALPESELFVESQKLGIIVAGITLAATIFTTALIFYFLNRLVVARIRDLGQVAEDIGAGRLDSRAQVKNKDELGSLALQFNKMAVGLQKTDRLKDEFLAKTSHELRTPLNGIIGLSESLMDGVGGKLTEVQHFNLNLIMQSGQRLFHLVNDILDFSKMRHHELKLKLVPVDLGAVIHVIFPLAKTLLGPKKVELHNNVSEDLPLIMADVDRLRQILLNLLGNAIKFTESGSVTIFAEAKDGFVLISVTDTGIGIPEEQQPTIFDSFVQGDGSTTRSYGGTGLGLSITQSFVKLHGGTIEVQSVQEKGSTFTFSIPVSKNQNRDDMAKLEEEGHDTVHNFRPAVSDAMDESIPEDAESVVLDEITPEDFHIESEERPTILIVDDEPVNVQVLTNILHLHDFQTLLAPNGFQALKIIEEQKPNLVLLDLMMPRMSGYEVCQKIRETHEATALPIIILTAKDQIGDLIEGLHRGANDYLSKPFHKDELLARVRTHLRLSNTNLELVGAKSRLELLLLSTKELAASRFKKNCVGEFANAILQQLPGDEIHLRFAFWEEAQQTYHCFGGHSEMAGELRFFRVETFPNVEQFIESAKLVSSDDGGELAQQLRSFLEDGHLCVPVWRRGNLHCYLEMEGFEKDSIQSEHLEFADTLSQSLSITLENLSFIHNLEFKVAQQTQQIQDVLNTLEERHEQLKQTQTQLVQSEKMAGLGTLVAGVAHEINNPTNFVYNGAQNLGRHLKRLKSFILELAEDSNEEQIRELFEPKLRPLHENLEAILVGSQRISLIVKDLRTFSRLDEAERKEADIVEGIKSTLGIVSPSYRKQVRFNCEFDEQIMLPCWSAQLNQVFMNLISNGCQAIASKQEKENTEEMGTLTIRTHLTDEHYVVSFTDTGTGIPESNQKKIFDPFFTTKTVGEGTGLGLSISYGIIEKHEGTITLESIEGEGSTFNVLLPLNSSLDLNQDVESSS